MDQRSIEPNKVPAADFEIDSALDKSFGLLSNYPMMNQSESALLGKIVGNKDSNTSLCNFDAFDDKNAISKNIIMERDLIIKNSFNEWSKTGAQRVNT